MLKSLLNIIHIAGSLLCSSPPPQTLLAFVSHIPREEGTFNNCYLFPQAHQAETVWDRQT